MDLSRRDALAALAATGVAGVADGNEVEVDVEGVETLEFTARRD